MFSSDTSFLLKVETEHDHSAEFETFLVSKRDAASLRLSINGKNSEIAVLQSSLDLEKDPRIRDVLLNEIAQLRVDVNRLRERFEKIKVKIGETIVTSL